MSDKSGVNTLIEEQEKLMQAQLDYVYKHSPFYKKHFDAHGISVEDIRTLKDLQRIPSVSKQEIQKQFKDFWCVKPTEIVDYTNTSGTEGQPVTIPITEKDLERLAYNEMLSLACTGGNEKEVYQLTTTIDRRFMAGLAYLMGARKLKAGMIRTGPGLPQLQWQTIHELNTTALIVVPSFLVKLIDFAKANNIDYKASSVKKAVCIGEPIRNSDFSLNALGRRIKDLWDIELYSTYASSEMATAFTECEVGNGGHVLHQLVITEILDEDGNPVPEGQAGELTITNLGIEGFPLVRFRTGDILAKHNDACACGRKTPRLGPVIGRKHQMIKHKGTTCYPPAIFDVLDHIPDINHYQVVITSSDLGNDEVLIRYSHHGELSAKELTNYFKAGIRFTPKFELMTNEEIIPLIHRPDKRKPVKLIDERQKSSVH